MSDEPNLTTPSALVDEARAALDALGVISNAKSGLGVASRDRSEAATVADVTTLDEATLTALWRKSALVKRLCVKAPKVAVSKGVVLATPKGDAAWLQEELARLDALALGVLGRAWGNLYGYCLVAVTIEGQDPASPLLPGAAVRRVAKLTTYDRHEVNQITYDDGALNPARTGEPLSYTVRAGTSVVTYHASRVFRFNGAPLPRRARTQNNGSDDSVILGPYPALVRFWQAVQGLGTMLHDSSVGVWKIKGLSNWINAGNRAAIQTWIETQLLFRGILGDHALDEGSDFEFKARAIDGAEKIFRALMDDLAAEVDLPRSELFGIAASGLNASEESDRKKWHESVEKDERPVWTRYLQWLIPILQRQPACPRDLRAQPIGVTWPPLEVQSQAEEDAHEKAQVDAEVALVNLGALRPEEVRARLASSPRYTLDTPANDAAPVPESFKPPAGAAREAARGLALREKFGRGGTAIGVKRANQLANREPLSAETVVRMLAFFDRFKGEVGQTNANGRAWGDENNPSNAWIAWLLWGGGAGRRWAQGIVRRYELTAQDAAPARPRPALTPEADALPFTFWLGFRVPDQIAIARPPLSLDDSPAHVTLLTWSQASPDPSAAIAMIGTQTDGGAGRLTLGEVASWIGHDGAVIFQRVHVEHEVRMDRLRDDVDDLLVEMNAIPNKADNYWRPHFTLAYLPTPTSTWTGARVEGSWWGSELEVWGRGPDGSVRVWAKIPLA